MEIPWIPVNDKVLLQVDVVEEQTSGGIIIPQTERDRLQLKKSTSTVVAIAEFAFYDFGERLPAAPFKVGDKVLTKEYPGIVVSGVEGKGEFRLVNWKDILAVKPE